MTRRPPTVRRAAAFAIAAGVLAFAFAGSASWVRVGVLFCVAVVGALGMNVVTGLARQFSVGQAAFMAIGAYGTGVLVVDAGWSYLLAIPTATLVAGAVGLAFAPIALRLRNLGLAMTTLGLLFVVQHLITSIELFGSSGRPKFVPDMQLFGVSFADTSVHLGVELTREEKYFLLYGVAAALCFAVTKNLIASRYGRNMSSLGEAANEIAAAHAGVRIARTKTQAFVVSSLLAGLAGGLLAPFIRVLQPESFGLALSVEYLAMIVIGGLGTAEGAVLGALFVSMLPEVIRNLAPHLPFIASEGGSGPFTVAAFATLLYGVLLVVVLMFEPAGLEGLLRRLRRAARRSAGRVQPAST